MQPHNLGHDGQTRDHYGVVVRLERVKDNLNKRIQPGHHFVLSGLRSSVVCYYLLLFQSLLQALKSKLSQNPAADFFRLLAVNRLVALQPQHFHFHIHLFLLLCAPLFHTFFDSCTVVAFFFLVVYLYLCCQRYASLNY